MVNDTPIEKPLSAVAKFRIVLAGSSLVLLFYSFVFVATLLLFLLLACEGILIVAAARFGLAGLVGRMMGRHIGLTSVFLRSFWVRKGTDYRLALSEADAPQLFDRLRDLCGKLHLRMPREVWLEMSLGAWVRLKGFTRGSRNTILGIGYDLLAGLNQNEIDGVLAHEMVHAKLVQRGFKRWLGGGLNRASRLCQGLWNYIAQAKRTKQEADFADSFWTTSDWLTRKIASQFAAYARQDEFEADRGAAELVGAGAIGSALKKLETLQNIVWRLPWSERVAQLHSGQSISEWILAELQRED